MAVVADLVDVVAERVFGDECAVAEHEAADQSARAEVVVPDLERHFFLELDGTIRADDFGVDEAVDPVRRAAAIARLEIAIARADDAAVATQGECVRRECDEGEDQGGANPHDGGNSVAGDASTARRGQGSSAQPWVSPARPRRICAMTSGAYSNES
jgi:hypothetical protein